MKVLNRLLWTAALACLAVYGGVFAKSDGSDRAGFTAADNEFYLTEEVYYFFRPGLDVGFISIEIPADRQPLVTFSLKDPMGMPLDMDGVYTPGDVSVRMILTYIPEAEEQKVNYHGGSYDRGGEFNALGDGVYTYKFATVLPEDYDADATHTLAIAARRDLRDYDLDRYSDNVVYNYVPSGAEMVTPPRDIVRTETCNRCHDPLGMHGGRYMEVQVCQQCHLPALEEDGVSYSMDVMIHRVHAEAEHYPTSINDCEVCHTGGTPTADFPLVANPNPATSCDGKGLGMTTVSWADAGDVEVRVNAENGPLFAASGGAGSQETGMWVRDDTSFVLVDSASGDAVKNGQAPMNLTVFGCVSNAPGTFRGKAGDLHTRWLNRPSRAVCGACHSDIDFDLGVGHPEMPTDEFCGYCHLPSGREYGGSIRGAHQVDYKSAQLGGVLVDVIDISNTGPGQRPIVTFALSNKWGPLPPSELGRMRFTLSGPNEDFTFYVREESINSLKAVGPYWEYQFEEALPADAKGSYTLGFEGRINSVTLNPGTNDEFTMRDPAQNYTVPFMVTGGRVEPRRLVVDDAKCENCHGNLSLHGTNRHNASEYCQTCHMPSMTDEADINPQSVDFRYMVHKIHRGADLENGYVIGGSDDFSDVEYPGDLRNCEACHFGPTDGPRVSPTYTLPLQAGLEYVDTPSELITSMGPATAACLSCHDSDAAAIHASTNSNELGEACSACHGTGKTYSVERLHAR